MRIPRGDHYRSKGVKIGNKCRIWGVIDTKYPDVVIGDNVVLGGESRILTHCPIKGINADKMSIRILDNVWIGFRCIILPGTYIGPRTIVGAGSVVSGRLNSDSIYTGNPAKFIKKRNKCEIVRTYLLVTQNLVVSTPKVKPNWNISKKEIIKLFDLQKGEYDESYANLRDQNYCYEVLLNG